MMKALLWTLVILCSSAAYAGQVTIPNTFTAGTKAKAAEVNANFITLEQGVNDNDTKITQNTSDIYSNSSGVGINAAGVLGNASNIATNTSVITTNSASITTVQASIPTTYQVVDSYGSVLGDLIGASMNTMTFITPQGYISTVEKSAAYNGLVYGESTYLTGTAPVDMPYDQYATPDCTGVPLPKLSKSYAQGTLFRHIVLDGGVPSPFTYTSPVLFSETLVYIPLNEPFVTINYSSDVVMIYDYATSLATATCRTTAILGGTKSITGYHYYPNDPVVTGIPNVIGFPPIIQKK